EPVRRKRLPNTFDNWASGKSKECPVLPRIMSKWDRDTGSQRCGVAFGNEPTLVCHSLCRAHPAATMLPSHRKTTHRKTWTRRWSTRASPFFSGKTLTDHLILRPATYPFRRYQHPVGRSWRMDETYVKIKGKWAYLYRAVL